MSSTKAKGVERIKTVQGSQYSKELLRRFGGNHRAVEEHCKGKSFTPLDLDQVVRNGRRRVFKEGKNVHRRPQPVKFHKLGLKVNRSTRTK